MAFNVLVVDDSAAMRSIIIKTLRISGVPLGEVYQAGNGQEGLQAVEENWIDLALVDLNMPTMGGEEMITQLRANPDTENLPIVVISTESSDTRIASLRGQGAGFIHKPFKPEELREQISFITGVSNESFDEGGAVSGSGFDF
jgi:two-component system, chemotaxis family, chemotaxis protein CheY